MHFKTIPSLLAALVLLAALPACRPADPQTALDRMSAQEHFAAGQVAANQEETLPLALWHFQSAASQARPGTPLCDSARLEESRCRALLRDAWGKAEELTGERRSLEEENRLLKTRNQELERWLSRLNAENLALRQSLLKVQERQGAQP